jgi:hypothetical protein
MESPVCVSPALFPREGAKADKISLDMAGTNPMGASRHL